MVTQSKVMWLFEWQPEIFRLWTDLDFFPFGLRQFIVHTV